MYLRVSTSTQVSKSRPAGQIRPANELSMAPGMIFEVLEPARRPQPPATVLHAPKLHSPQCNGSPRTHHSAASGPRLHSSAFRADVNFQQPPSPIMAKRKVDGENRGFKVRWEAEYMFTEVKGKPVCRAGLAIGRTGQ